MKFRTLYLVIFLPVLYFSIWFIWTIGYISTFERLVGSLFCFVIIFLPYFFIEKKEEKQDD